MFSIEKMGIFLEENIMARVQDSICFLKVCLYLKES
jgi:hypothetical protein